MDQVVFFSELLSKINGIYTWTYSSDFELESTNCALPELGFYQSRNHSLFHRIQSAETPKDVPMILSDDLGLMWICISGEISDHTHLYLLGPVLPADAPISGIKQQMQKKSMNKAQQDEVLAFISAVPTISLTNIFQYAIMFAYSLNRQVYGLSDIIMFAQNEEPHASDSSNDSRQNARGNYAFEAFYLKLVEDGNLQYKELLSNYAAIGDVGKLSNQSALQNAKNTCIPTVTLCSRAAMRGGLPPETAYSMSNFYIQAIDSATSVSEVYAHNSSMLDDYIHKVHDYKALHQNFSKMIADADAFISLHLTEDISIESIARELGYSKYYFSAAFKKSTGKTVNEYIRDRRLEYAKMQLLTSDEKISQLSERLHFISPSYFTKCFKAYFGLTPNDLRATKQ